MGGAVGATDAATVEAIVKDVVDESPSVVFTPNVVDVETSLVSVVSLSSPSAQLTPIVVIASARIGLVHKTFDLGLMVHLR